MWKWQAEGEAKGVVVLIHSAYEEHQRYAWQIEKWRRNGFHVYMGDLPGHGTLASPDSVHREPFLNMIRQLPNYCACQRERVCRSSFLDTDLALRSPSMPCQNSAIPWLAPY